MPTVLFDLFGVIARVQSPESLRTIEEAAGTDDPDRFWRTYWRARPDYDAGRLDGPAYWARVGRLLSADYDSARIRSLIGADLASWDTVDEGMVDVLCQLAGRGTRLGLLSNIPSELADRYAERRWMDTFDVVGFSCRIGAIKPEPEAFDWCLGRLGVDAREVTFVDDARVNVDAARTLGMTGHLFAGRARLAVALGL